MDHAIPVVGLWVFSKRRNRRISVVSPCPIISWANPCKPIITRRASKLTNWNGLHELGRSAAHLQFSHVQIPSHFETVAVRGWPLDCNSWIFTIKPVDL